MKYIYIYIYIYEKRNFVKIFKLHNYNDFYINRKDFFKMNFFFKYTKMNFVNIL